MNLPPQRMPPTPLPAAPSLAATCQTGDHHPDRSGLSFLTAATGHNRPTRAGARREPSMRARPSLLETAPGRESRRLFGGV